jgi:hypothetical protein
MGVDLAENARRGMLVLSDFSSQKIAGNFSCRGGGTRNLWQSIKSITNHQSNPSQIINH